ncbi:HlyD family efflux transporter periplasmic adaptor subunit [Scatolibacter rhodanostii]|uniref:HlyD family efflux transporter periplasmic adaptor subunit n=1 Tax=Scatolibacter rhodanostii TaxID=2014781 RepID=UPI000C088A77|nr:HlyD family efflux transporter periplasmic adaptor subunit [Scatolibacter rhodanostii]
MKFEIRRQQKHRAERMRSEGQPEGNMIVQNKESKLKNWREYLPKMTDENQRRAGKHIVVFFAVMLILTVAARGISGATYARVQTEKPSRAEIVEAISATANVKASDSIDITMPEGLTVSRLLATVGQSVKAGDSLLEVDTKTLTEKLDELKSQLSSKEIDLNESKLPAVESESQVEMAQKALSRLQEDYQSVKNSAAQTVQQAQTALDNANAELAAAREAWQQAQNRVVEAAAESKNQSAPTSSPDDTSIPEETSSPVENMAGYEEAIRQAEQAVVGAEQALTGAKEQSQEQIKSADRQIEDARQALTNAQKADTQTQNQKNIEDQKKKLTVETTQKEIDKLKEQIAGLQTIADAKGVITTTQDGEVKTLPAEGTVTSAETILQVSNLAGSFEAEAQFTKADAKKLSPKATVEIQVTTDSYYSEEALQGEIISISQPDETGMATAKIKLPEGKWKSGQSLGVKALQSKKTYDSCLPLAAVRSDSDGFFILAMEERTTILGVENVLVKYPVTVPAKTAEKAAVEGNIPWEASIVVTSTKPIAAGDRVRVMEE